MVSNLERLLATPLIAGFIQAFNQDFASMTTYMGYAHHGQYTPVATVKYTKWQGDYKHSLKFDKNIF